MKYKSTRGGTQGSTFEEALFSGYTPDGGMYLPDSIPDVDASVIKSWATLSYIDIVKNVVGLFVSEEEIPKADMDALLDKAFARFAIADVMKMARLQDDLNLLELFHGPTLAFKDLALSCVGQLLEYFLEKRKEHITIIVGTSGDTGSASIESIRGLHWVDIVVLLPKGRCSRVQELQMTTVLEDNVHLFRVDGSSDDLDVPIKACFTDAELVAKHNLCSINSINWGRIMVQIAHYFYAYYQVCPDCTGEVEVAIPTGACGNVTGGVIARLMGLPVKFVCTVNSNDIVARTLQNGDYSLAENVVQSLACSMDIQVPYNIERILCLLSGGDTTLVNKLLTQFETEGRMKIPEALHAKMCDIFSSYIVTDDEIRHTMRRCWDVNKYLICPHTAVAAKYHYDVKDGKDGCGGKSNVRRVCLATASPAKFEEAVLSAGLTPQPTDALNALANKPTRFEEMCKGEDWERMLRMKIEDIYQHRHVQ